MAAAESPLKDIQNTGMKKGTSNKRMSIERIYQKKSQLEHILLRPDTYVGSVEHLTQPMMVYDSQNESILSKNITFVPGFYKIFDEILVNAADNKQRDPTMSCIKITIDSKDSKIKIWNDGKGIPVEMHKEYNMFVPTLIFGHLLTSSNYNDEEKKVTGGRNGFGAKLCNVFSKKFIVETSNGKSGKRFKQTWRNNMGKAEDPEITDSKGKDFTSLTYWPDLTKFKMDGLDNDTISLLTRRAYDLAGTLRGVTIYLNGEKLKVTNFREYVDLYLKGAAEEAKKDGDNEIKSKVIHEVVNPRWEVCITVSEGGFQQASFVNGIATTKGGTHVQYVADQLVEKLLAVVKKKVTKGITVKPFQIKNHMWIFVNCLIVNPTFDSQTKENMTLRPKDFGSTCDLSEKFIKGVKDCGVIEQVMNWVKGKQMDQLSKKHSSSKHSKLKGIPKLDDANDAGTKHSRECTLILTEGDSAKTLAISGLSVIGRDRYGVFPLRGKLLNVRDASHKQIMENAEITNIVKIMGLQYKKKYEKEDDLKSLRYGKLMIMTDQDQDGSHIKGLLINFIHFNWPSLLRLEFLEEFITPIVKVSKKTSILSFYSIPEYEEWKGNTPNHKSWKLKYYKGLGTSTPKEAKEYFADMERHRIPFSYSGNTDDFAIEMAFSRKKVQERKDWLTSSLEEKKMRREAGLPDMFLYGQQTTDINYTDFINQELILFSNADNERSIPSVVDGLKPGQRKIIFTCMKRNDKKEVKVAQLAGSVAELSAYHHGETSLMSTIINLAQNFVGSNNLNLLQPIGQFGTRIHGGKDAASPRYIFTMLSTLTKMIFNVNDESNLNVLFDDGQRVEPEWYCPIIPMCLVNGAEGIGTGYSTKVPNFDIKDIVENIKRMLIGEEPIDMSPSYKNFNGTTTQVEPQKFVVSGIINVLDEKTVEITELPVFTWTQNYKENVLEPMLHGSDKVQPFITDYKEYHTDCSVRFVVTMSEANLAQAEQQGLHKKFKLESNINMTNMVMFDRYGCLKKYNSIGEILREFYSLRLEFYIRRKAYLEGMLAAEAMKLDNQARFIMEKIDGSIVIENKSKRDLITMLVQRGYKSDPVKTWKDEQVAASAATFDDSESDTSSVSSSSETGSGPDFNYLLGMSMWSLSKEKKEELLKNRDDKAEELNVLRGKAPKDLWSDDLDAFLVELDVVEQQELEDIAVGTKISAKGRAMKSKAAVKKPRNTIKKALEKTAGKVKKEATKAVPKTKETETKNSSDEYRFSEESEDQEKPVLSLAERIGLKKNQDPFAASETSSASSLSKPAAKKQQTLKFGGGKKTATKKKFLSVSDDSDNSFSIDSFSDNDDNEGDSPPVMKRTARAAAAKAAIKFSDSEDDDVILDKDDKSFEISDDDGDDFATIMKSNLTSATEKLSSIAEGIEEHSDSDKSDVAATRDLIKKLTPVKASRPSTALKISSPQDSQKNAAKDKKAPARKAPAKKAAGKKADPKQPSIMSAFGSKRKPQVSDDSDDDMVVVSKTKKTTKSSSSEGEPSSRAKKSIAPKKNTKKIVDDEDSDDSVQIIPKKSVAKKRPAPAKKSSIDTDEDSDASTTSQKTTAKKSSAQAKPKAKKGKSAPKKKRVMESSDEEDALSISSEGSEKVIVSRQKRTKAPVKYQDSADEEGNGNNDSDSDFSPQD